MATRLSADRLLDGHPDYETELTPAGQAFVAGGRFEFREPKAWTEIELLAVDLIFPDGAGF